MRIPLLVLPLAAALALAPRPAAAQQAPADSAVLPSGIKVRVSDGGGARVADGRFWYLRSDTLWLLGALNDPSTSASVPNPAARRVEVSRGRRRELWGTVGAVLGLAVGAGVALAAEGDAPASSGDARRTSHAVSGGAAGGVVGGLVGWLIAPERWRRVNIPAPLPPPAQTAQAPADANPR